MNDDRETGDDGDGCNEVDEAEKSVPVRTPP